MASMLMGQVPTSNPSSRPISRPICRQKDSPEPQISRREVVLRSSEMATLAAIFHFSGTKPNYLGVQKSPPSLALCPVTNNCISTSEEKNDLKHYVPPWNYNPQDGRKKKTTSRDEAMAELLQVVESIKPDNFSAHVVEKKEDYVRVDS
ncbi:uncharacterized protein LOC103697526 isoform X4 [Phoenix dactylifera]|uniref:Uncharacterized protein LOC103697526 isoform X4 n=1 Tax=Phoenix dactylifera TaxID=42345 RepID=A0A8B8ZJN9_PHODC|nr:uncharacterized protein LOC103697526 isoform X4 [Phoenix dactylifera]